MGKTGEAVRGRFAVSDAKWHNGRGPLPQGGFARAVGQAFLPVSRQLENL